MLRYLAYMQDVRARADVGRLSPQLNALDRRVAELEKPISVLREQAENLKLRERKSAKRQLSVTQKAWKLAREVKKRAFK
jgi:predicted RNase H-like nuclease (RuvC/YqgF family)